MLWIQQQMLLKVIKARMSPKVEENLKAMLQNKFNGQNNISEADYNKILNEIKKNIIENKENLKKLMNEKFDELYKKGSLLEETIKTALKNQEEINK